MAINSLSDIASIIKYQIDIQEVLNEYLCKVEAMVCVTSSEDFLDYEPSIIHAYLWALNSLITDAKKFNQQSLDALLKNGRNLRQE